MKIRSYIAKDAAALRQLYLRSVAEIGRQHYTSRQISAWASRAPTHQRIHELATDGRSTFVATDLEDQPIAFGDLEPNGHIDFLYCAPEAVGTGVASALYEKLEEFAVANQIKRIHSEASEPARRFFLKKGFVVLSRRELEITGVRIHNYAVEKILTR